MCETISQTISYWGKSQVTEWSLYVEFLEFEILFMIKKLIFSERIHHWTVNRRIDESVLNTTHTPQVYTRTTWSKLQRNANIYLTQIAFHELSDRTSRTVIIIQKQNASHAAQAIILQMSRAHSPSSYGKITESTIRDWKNNLMCGLPLSCICSAHWNYGD